MWDPYAEFESATLPNGLTIHAAHWPSRPWEVIGFLIHSGAEQDPVGLEGLAHFVEHLVAENSGVSKKDIHAFFRDNGGWAKLGGTSYAFTKYGLFVPIDKQIIAKALSMFGNMLISCRIKRFIDRKKQIIIQEFHRSHPVQFEFEGELRKQKALYSGYWPERFVSPLGDPESIERITQIDIQSYYDEYYTPANISIVGVGGLTLIELVELLSESPFKANKKGARMPLPVPSTDAPLPLENRQVFERSSRIQLDSPPNTGSYESDARIPSNISYRVLQILSGMLNEILNEEIRERRAWTYHIESLWKNYRLFYEFSISCGTLAFEALEGIEEAVENCIASLIDREDLFEQTKRRSLVGSLMIDDSGQEVCDNALSDLAIIDRIVTLTDIRNDIERITMDDIRVVLQWLRPERRYTVITKP